MKILLVHPAHEKLEVILGMVCHLHRLTPLPPSNTAAQVNNRLYRMNMAQYVHGTR